MKKQLALLLVLIIVSGCVGTQVVVPQDRLNKVKKIAVVPMEPPPIEIPPFVSTDSLFASSAIMATVPVESIQESRGPSSRRRSRPRPGPYYGCG